MLSIHSQSNRKLYMADMINSQQFLICEFFLNINLQAYSISSKFYFIFNILVVLRTNQTYLAQMTIWLLLTGFTWAILVTQFTKLEKTDQHDLRM